MANIAFGNNRPSFSDRTSTGIHTRIQELGTGHKERIERYRKNWEYYEGEQWDTAAFIHKDVTLNFCRRLVDIKASFLNKGGFKITIPDVSDEDGEDDTITRQFIKNMLDRTWRMNELKNWFVSATQTGGVTGDVFIRVSWDTSQEVPFAKADILPSNYCFPNYNDITGKVDHLRILIPFTDTVPSLSLVSRRVKEKQVERIYEEVWTNDTVTYLIDNEVTNTQPNIIGEIPFVHIHNYPNSNGHFGISDLVDITAVQKLLNEKATDISDIIDYHGSPITIAYGMKPHELVKGPDKIWAVPSKKDGADIQTLQLIGDLKASLDFLDVLRKSMLDLSGVPDQAVNPTTNVSNTPGVALHMTYLPLIEVRAIKEIAYGTGIEKVNRLIIKMNEALDAEFRTELDKLPTATKYINIVTFAEALPRDEQLMIENNRSELDMGLNTRKRILMTQKGMSSKDADRLIEEADEEKKKIAELTTLEEKAQSSTQKGEAFGKGRRPDPVVQGDRVSRQS